MGTINPEDLKIEQEDDGTWTVTSGDDMYHNADSYDECEEFIKSLVAHILQEELEDDVSP